MSTTKAPSPLPIPQSPYFDPKTGLPSKEFALYMQTLDAAVRALCNKI